MPIKILPARICAWLESRRKSHRGHANTHRSNFFKRVFHPVTFTIARDRRRDFNIVSVRVNDGYSRIFFLPPFLLYLYIFLCFRKNPSTVQFLFLSLSSLLLLLLCKLRETYLSLYTIIIIETRKQIECVSDDVTAALYPA